MSHRATVCVLIKLSQMYIDTCFWFSSKPRFCQSLNIRIILKKPCSNQDIPNTYLQNFLMHVITSIKKKKKNNPWLVRFVYPVKLKLTVLLALHEPVLLVHPWVFDSQDHEFCFISPCIVPYSFDIFIKLSCVSLLFMLFVNIAIHWSCSFL